ncbi:hypothetical protein [Flavobacterium branchiicola]|uniref:Uncharacterized protein n=1 Tax=Flavobacterium branchiicola TaxID=1114875 RepID=A0ABV9PAL5_9FLAO|nr:hypothetical protein [Flavobacterium branchiicola]MBS7254287.1 hypothetical protein [Flavobacterium branchiicola]
MEKEKILVRDSKGVFLKMFKRKFKDEFDFVDESFLLKNENESFHYDRSIFVVYDKTEILQFLKLENKGKNVLVCLFNKQLHNTLSFLNEILNVIVLDNAKTKPEIINELKMYLKSNVPFCNKDNEVSFLNPPIYQTQFQNLYKALFHLT